jgi:hypothetical protein
MLGRWCKHMAVTEAVVGGSMHCLLTLLYPSTTSFRRTAGVRICMYSGSACCSVCFLSAVPKFQACD